MPAPDLVYVDEPTCVKTRDAAIALGPAVVAHVIRVLDAPQANAMVVMHLYAVIAGVEDAGVVPIMVERLERAAAGGVPATEAPEIVGVLEKTTGAGLNETTTYERSFAGRTLTPPEISTLATAWRRWLTAHADQPRDQMLAGRAGRAREILVRPPSWSAAYLAAVFLANQPAWRAEGLRALADLADHHDAELRREDLDLTGFVQWAISEATGGHKVGVMYGMH